MWWLDFAASDSLTLTTHPSQLATHTPLLCLCAECASWRTCSAGTFISQEGTSTSNKQCTTCLSGTFSTTADASCKTQTHATPHHSISFIHSHLLALRFISSLYHSSPTLLTHMYTACDSVTACVPGTYITKQPTTTSDQECAACPDTKFTSQQDLSCQ